MIEKVEFERRSQYGLRKLNIGMVSVVFGTLLWIGHSSNVQAAEDEGITNISNQPETTANTSNNEAAEPHQEDVANTAVSTERSNVSSVEAPSNDLQGATSSTAIETERQDNGIERSDTPDEISPSTGFRSANDTHVSMDMEPKVREQLVDGETQRIYQKPVAVLKNSNSAQSMGMQRGTYQARDSLGIIVPANTKLYIQQAGAERSTDLRVSLMTNDGHYNKNKVIPKTGEWVSIETGIDSAAFVYMPRGLTYLPNVVYYVEQQKDKALPTYRKGQNQAAFEQQWIDQDSAYAYVDGTHHAMLIPRQDREHVLSMKTQTNKASFKSLDEMIDYYEDVISHYNQWTGFVDDAMSVNFNIGNKYFIVANKNGFGAAYWSTDHTGTNSPSIAPYLQRGWLVLHEIGHGYDGWMKQDDRMGLGEVINNVLANQYEQTIQHEQNGWLYGKNQQGFQQDIHEKLLSSNNKLEFSTSGFKGKLDFMTRLVRLTGIDGMTRMYQAIREQAAQGNTAVDVPKWVAKDWLAAQGVNGLAYFDLYNIDISRLLRDEVNAFRHSYAYPLAMLIEDEIERQKYMDRLGLATAYELVKSIDLKDTRIQTQATVHMNLQGQQLRDNAQVVLLDGNEKVAEAVVNNGIAQFKHLRVGVYQIVAPATLNNGLPEHAYLVVRENGSNQITLNYPSSAQPQQFVSQQILLKGLGDEVFARMVYKPQTGYLNYQEYAKKPHEYFSDEYAHVTVRTRDGRVLVDKSMIGNQSGEAVTMYRKLQVGDTITVTHREPRQRRVVQRIETGETVAMKDADMQTVTYTLTDKGFIVNNETQQDANRRYVQTLEKDVEAWLAKKESLPESDMRVPLYRLVQALQLVHSPESERLIARLTPYLDPQTRLASPYIEDVRYGAGQLQGTSVARASLMVTVPSGQTYQVTADNNGKWSLELRETERLNMSGEVTVQAYKEGYKLSELVRQTIVMPPPPSTPEFEQFDEVRNRILGHSDAGVRVQVGLPNGQMYTVQADEHGAWYITLPETVELQNQDIVRAVALDKAGQVSDSAQLQIKRLNDEAHTIETPVDNEVNDATHSTTSQTITPPVSIDDKPVTTDENTESLDAEMQHSDVVEESVITAEQPPVTKTNMKQPIIASTGVVIDLKSRVQKAHLTKGNSVSSSWYQLKDVGINDKTPMIMTKEPQEISTKYLRNHTVNDERAYHALTQQLDDKLSNNQKVLLPETGRHEGVISSQLHTIGSWLISMLGALIILGRFKWNAKKQSE
ncbi:putative mucin/carbohydrate-binding domain-containing protein [Staphylococcus americanisciuri]|uniref:M60 family metallopeptidase n=1 Tax=Staphylococcus americanisciuri TaxID=2973940 RepID=A0ABT2F3M3_9STAP|nr:putative mucin/carbohydrate-binding domain-containing protein [Staphylococcus americanisciuri]MCS4487075.1 M60 family metallopeptidase [Staphylococcus americanisciuri]